jgi:hypothetical protein
MGRGRQGDTDDLRDVRYDILRGGWERVRARQPRDQRESAGASGRRACPAVRESPSTPGIVAVACEKRCELFVDSKWRTLSILSAKFRYECRRRSLILTG